MYEEYQSDVDKMRKMVESLKAFHDQTHALDTNHQDQMRNFNNTIQSLFSQQGTFTGQAADTLKDVAGKYSQGEHTFTGNLGDTSPQLASATGYNNTTAKNIQDYLDTLDADMLSYNNKLIDMINENVLQREATIITNNIFQGPYAGVQLQDVQAYADGQCVYPPQTQDLVQKMQWEQWQWDNNMGNVANDPLPALPPAPTDPTQYKPGPNSILYPSNQHTPMNALTQEEKDRLQDIKKELRGTQFDSKEIIDLMREGYTDDQIIAMMRARQILTKYNNGNDKFTYDDNYFKALAKKGLDSQYLADAVMAGTSAGITIDLSKEQIMEKIDDLNSRILDNQDGKEFSVNERSVAYYLSSQGYTVIAQKESEEDGQRRADTQVITPEGETYELEIKTITKNPATIKSVITAIKSATHDTAQADHIIIDGRGKGLTGADAYAGVMDKLNDLRNSGVKFVRVLGDGFDQTYDVKKLSGR